MIKVAKFGGSSLSDSSSFKRVKSIVESDKLKQVVVVSAPGKSSQYDNKITDLLYLLYAHIKYGVSYQSVFDLIKERFLTIENELGLDVGIKKEFDSLKKELSKNMSEEYLVSRGEYFNALLMSKFLGYAFVDSIDLLKYDYDGLLNNELTKEAFQSKFDQVGPMVIPGFYGSYPNGSVRLLSRGGSDLTGSIAAFALNASVYENWTDVSGILMADPKIVKNPKQISQITYEELRELSYMGANVLHEDSILPLQGVDIPINIKNTFAPDEPGTIIQAHCTDDSSIITGISGKKDFTVFTITKSNKSKKIKVIQDVLSVFERFNVNIEHIPSSIDSFSVICEAVQVEKVFYNLIGSINQIEDVLRIDTEKEMALISIVGRNMSTKPGIAGRLFGLLGAKKININMIAQSSQEINIVVGVKNDDFERTIETIYESFSD